MFHKNIFTIAQNTWMELRHRKVIAIILMTYIFGFFFPLFIQSKLSMTFGASSGQTSTITTSSEFTLWIGLIFCLFYAAGLVEKETNRRTLASVMIRPIQRWEYLSGRIVGVLFVFALFGLITLACAYLAAFITDSQLPTSFSIGVLQRMCRGIGLIFVAASLGSVLSATNTMLIFVAMGFFSLVFSILTKDLHWSITWASNFFYYAMPCKLSTDFMEGFEKISETKLMWLGAGAMVENLLYGLFIFIPFCWLFETRDLRLREE